MRSIALVALALIATTAAAAVAGGRRPYGGSVDVAVKDLSGLVDPHTVETRSGRLAADLVHARLLRFADGRVSGELSEDLGQVEGDTLVFTLVEGARFHDGAPVESPDVVASLRRLAALGDQAPLGRLFAALQVSARGPRGVAVAMPRGAHPDEVRLLLARPEAAIIRGPSRVGAGPFKPGSAEGERRVLVAWDGYALGRPWLQQVRLVKVEPEREEAALRFGDVDVGFVKPERPVGAIAVAAGQASWFLLFHPRYRAQQGFRGFVRQTLIDARLARYLDGRPSLGEVPWPEPLAPVTTSPRAAQSASGRAELIIAFAPGEGGEELARALRDALSPIARGNARVTSVAGLSVERGRGDPDWDMALVRYEWAALSRAQATFELARVFGLEPPRAEAVLARKVGDWALGVVSRYEAVAAAHVEVEAWVQSRISGVTRGASLPDFTGAWRVRAP